MDNVSANLASSAISGGASLVGSGLSAVANHFENKLAFERQKELADYQYSNYLKYARQAGATPTATMYGLTGHGVSSVPAVSSGGNPAPDFGQSIAAGLQGVSSVSQAGSSRITANSMKQINDMKLMFEPKKYFADVLQSVSTAFNQQKQGFYYGSLKSNIEEVTKDIVMMRPWKVQGALVDLTNKMAEYDNVVQDTRTKKAQERNFNASSAELGTRSDLNKANAYKSTEEGFNAALQGYRLQFENTLLSLGIDPNKSFWQNTLNLSVTNPKMFKARMDAFVTSLNMVDNRIQENLGEHYKRNAALGVGAYYLSNWNRQRKNDKAHRSAEFLRAISSFVPLTGGSPAPIGYKKY